MAGNPTYEELKQRLKELEKEVLDQLQAKESLELSNIQMLDTLESISDGFFSLDEQLVVTYFNKAAERLLGRKSWEVLGQNLFEAFPEAKGSIFEEKYTQGVNEKVPFFFETYFNVKPYENWYEVRVYPRADGISVYFQVTTAHKRTEEALREREATLESIFRAAPTGIGMVSNRVLKRVNDRICKMTGYSREELLDQSARMLYPTEEDFEYVGTEKYAQIRERGIGTVETRWRRKDGKVIDVLLSSTPVDPDDLTAGVTFTALDITERKRAEEELRESEDRYRRITEAITDYIYTVTVQDGRPGETIHGPACVAGTGYTTDDFKANPYLWIQMVHKEDRKAVEEQAARTLSGVKVPALEHRIIRKDGATRCVRNTPVMNFDSQGRPLSYDGLVQDITERKQAEEALRSSHDELGLRVKERTAELVKANDDLKHIPVIALTAHAMMGDEAKARACGCDDYMGKPLDEDLLFEKLDRFLGVGV